MDIYTYIYLYIHIYPTYIPCKILSLLVKIPLGIQTRKNQNFTLEDYIVVYMPCDPYICPVHRVYIYRYIYIYDICPDLFREFFWQLRERNTCTFNIYMGSCQAIIYNNITTSTSIFFRPWQKKIPGQSRALGIFFGSDEKTSVSGLYRGI